MILVLSQENNEPATDLVVEWLLEKKANFIRVNGEDLTNNEFAFKVEHTSEWQPALGCDVLKVGEQTIDLNSINVVWYRRWHNFQILNTLDNRDSNRIQARNHAVQEIKAFSRYLFSLLPHAKWLSDDITSNNNKLITLTKACKLGLKTPRTLITNNKKDLIDFYHTCNQKIITKPITNSFYFRKEKHLYSHYTEVVTEDIINSFPERFFLSHFQECVVKEYDLRIFFLDDEFYSVCVVPAPNTENVDIKLDHMGGTLRRVPYKLPLELEDKLRKLMKVLNLNTGSIDVMKDIKGDYYFIEVNPIGIFSDLSYYCNLNLEEKVADFLIKQDKKHEPVGNII